MYSNLRYRLRALFPRRSMEAELDAELGAHVEQQAEKYVQAGMSPEEAARRARLEFGGIEQVKEEVRDSWGVRMVSELAQDVCYGLRQLRRSPGFTAVVVIVLALGIGATTAIFSVVNAVLLRPLPFPQPSHLVSIRQGYTFGSGAVSYPNFFDWRAENHVFSQIAAFHESNFTLTGNGEPLYLPGATVTWGFFALLGVRPLLGQGFSPEDEKAGSYMAVLSHSLWQSRFKSNPAIVGRTITLEGKGYTVVGIMPAGFAFPIGAQPLALWTTIAADAEGKTPMTSQRGSDFLGVVARLKPHVTFAEAQTEMDLIDQRLAKQYPADDGDFTSVEINRQLKHVVQDVRPSLLMLLAAVACLLLISCANVSGLLLSRAMTRGKEIAIRAALGASRRRVIRQLLTQSVLLSLFGTIFGLLIASCGTTFLLGLCPVSIPHIQQIGVNVHVLVFDITLAIVTAIIFGGVPAFQVSNPNLVESLKEGGHRSSGAPRHHRLQAALVLTETGVALILLVGRGLLMASYLALHRIDPGFDPNHVLTFRFSLPDAKYTDAQQVSFYNCPTSAEMRPLIEVF